MSSFGWNSLNGNTQTLIRRTCSVCKRPLTDPVSIQRGVGPVCAIKKTGVIIKSFHLRASRLGPTVEPMTALKEIGFTEKDLLEVNLPVMGEGINTIGAVHESLRQSVRMLDAEPANLRAFDYAMVAAEKGGPRQRAAAVLAGLNGLSQLMTGVVCLTDSHVPEGMHGVLDEAVDKALSASGLKKYVEAAIAKEKSKQDQAALQAQAAITLLPGWGKDFSDRITAPRASGRLER